MVQIRLATINKHNNTDPDLYNNSADDVWLGGVKQMIVLIDD
jgi:hypothetical protein